MKLSVSDKLCPFSASDVRQFWLCIGEIKLPSWPAISEISLTTNLLNLKNKNYTDVFQRK